MIPLVIVAFLGLYLRPDPTGESSMITPAKPLARYLASGRSLATKTNCLRTSGNLGLMFERSYWHGQSLAITEHEGFEIYRAGVLRKFPRQ